MGPFLLVSTYSLNFLLIAFTIVSYNAFGDEWLHFRIVERPLNPLPAFTLHELGDLNSADATGCNLIHPWGGLRMAWRHDAAAGSAARHVSRRFTTPCSPALIMLLTALQPAPPTPKMVIRGLNSPMSIFFELMLMAAS
jgi:hypothetical protein